MSGTKPFAMVAIFEKLTDPRMNRTRAHKLIDIVAIAVCATIAGCDNWVEIVRFAQAKIAWFRKFLELPNGIPSHDTFGRTFAALDTGEFLACLKDWIDRLHISTKGEVVAIDGKTLRNSFDDATGKSALHLVSAWATHQKLTLGQVATDAKSNEITAIPKLLELLELSGAIVTIDAMGCQKDIAAAIVKRGADFVLALKDNHPKLCAAVSDHFVQLAENDFKDAGVRRMVETKKTKNGTETREYVIAPAPKDLPGRSEWKNLRSIGMVIRRRTRLDGTDIAEVRYYLVSLPAKVRQFADAVRSHWGIENRLHWTLDVTFSEDESRIRKGNAPETTALLRRLAVSILQRDTSSNDSLRVKRKAAGWDDAALEAILTGFQGN